MSASPTYLIYCDCRSLMLHWQRLSSFQMTVPQVMMCPSIS